MDEPVAQEETAYTVSYATITSPVTEAEVSYLSPNDITCEGCSTAAYCDQYICVCRPGYEGDGYECNSVCELDSVWSDGMCVLLDQSATTPQSEVLEDDSEEFGKHMSF